MKKIIRAYKTMVVYNNAHYQQNSQLLNQIILLEEGIEADIKNGWQPYGSPFYDANGEGKHIQAFVKYGSDFDVD
jgi:hypothetical protein